MNYLETKGRFVAWRIYTLGPGLTSKMFMMGKWNWCLKYSDAVYLEVSRETTESLPVPDKGSFVVNIYSDNESPITKKEEIIDKELHGVGTCLAKHMKKRNVNAPVTIGLEFLDLKAEAAGNDGKSYSIWDEECSEQNSANETLNKMLSDNIYSDIVIHAKDGSIEAHRAILASNSPVFRTMFSKNYVEKETSTVHINDMSLEACKAMVNFIYGKRDNKEIRANAMELTLAADKYDIINLKKFCETRLCENIGSDNVFDRIVFAHKYDLQELKSTCLFYLLKMDMILALREDYNTFLQEADCELITEVSNACLDARQAILRGVISSVSRPSTY